jgi:hypothetical protein
LPVTLDLASDWTTLLSLIKTAGKYVALDLSACTMTGSKYDPGAANTGESKIVSLVLPNVATSIKNGSQAALGFNATFRYFTALKSISGSSIISTGDYVFADCDSLTTVNFPKAETIGDYAFSSCDSLTTVDFPKAVTIGNSAFEFCENLTTVSFPKVTSIGRNAILYEGYAFSHCTNLTTAIFPEATSIKAEAFSNCDSLITVSFPEATSIGDGAFANCDSLTTATFPLATIIGSAAFYRCDSLTSVSFPEATSIGDSAFYYCSLATVNIPKATSIGEYAFGGVGTAVPLTVTLGSAAPTLGVKLFDNADYLNGVTVKVPAGATGYGTVPKTYSGSDTEVCWGNGFRGGGWNGSAFTGDASDINSYITLKIEPK